MLNRRTFLRTSLAATAGILSGCGSSPDTLNITMLQGSIPPQLVGDFRKSLDKANRFKLKPEVDLQKIFELLATWQKPQEEQSLIDSLPVVGKGKNQLANMVTLGDSWLEKAIADNLIQPLDTSKLESWDSLPDVWKDLVKRERQGNIDPQGQVYGAPYRWGNTLIAYRKDKINWTPTDWSDLWREELQGRISLVNSDREVIGLTLKKLGYSYNTTDLSQVPNLESELTKLNQQVKFYSSDKYLQPLVLGDTWLAVGWSTDILAITKRYPKIGVVVPANGTSLWADLWVQPRLQDNVSINETITNLLATWIDFCWQSKAAKQILLFSNAISPILTGESANLTAKATKNIFQDLNKNPILKSSLETFNKSEFIKPLTPEITTEYQNLWKQIRQLRNEERVKRNED